MYVGFGFTINVEPKCFHQICAGDEFILLTLSVLWI